MTIQPSISEHFLKEMNKLSIYLTKQEKIKIFFYPDKVNAHASIFLMSTLFSANAKVSVHLSLEPPKASNGELNILIGYKQKDASPSDKDNIIVIPREKQIQLKPSINVVSLNPVYMAVYLIENFIIVGEEKRYAAYSSIFQNANELQENEPVLNFILSQTGLRITKKSFSINGGISRPLVDALYSTVDPFYPNFSVCEPEKIVQALQKESIDPNLPYPQLDSNSIKKLADILSSEYKKVMKSASARDIVRPSLIFSYSNYDIDLKELGESIDISLEISPAALFSFYLGNAPLHLLLALRLRLIKKISDAIKLLMSNQFKKRENAVVIECSEKLPISFIGDLSRKFGIIDKKSLLACDVNGEVITSIYEMAKLNEKDRIIKSLVASKAIEFPFVKMY